MVALPVMHYKEPKRLQLQECVKDLDRRAHVPCDAFKFPLQLTVKCDYHARQMSARVLYDTLKTSTQHGAFVFLQDKKLVRLGHSVQKRRC
jgi:hypothetical protein